MLRAPFAAVFAISCAAAESPAPRHEAPDPPSMRSARVTIDYAGIEAWLACRRQHRAVAECEAASAATEGGRLAELARDGFGPPRADTPEAPSVDAVQALVGAMKKWPDVGIEVQRFFPEPVPVGIAVHVVGNGHGWGDAYVRDRPSDGRPVAILNALLIASQYKGGPEAQANDARDVLRHEAFHVLFHVYRRSAPSWRSWPQSPSPLQELQLVVLNEGIGHFADRWAELTDTGFPFERIAPALERLEVAAKRLAAETKRTPEVDELLRTANQGRYWEKYGSVTGMLFAYGVYKAEGERGLQEAVRCGPGRLVAAYTRASRATSSLPPLTPAVARWAETDLCASNRARSSIEP